MFRYDQIPSLIELAYDSWDRTTPNLGLQHGSENSTVLLIKQYVIESETVGFFRDHLASDRLVLTYGMDGI